jgi:hypothetical protein
MKNGTPYSKNSPESFGKALEFERKAKNRPAAQKGRSGIIKKPKNRMYIEITAQEVRRYGIFTC